jgi:UDP-N-acetylmuramate dehydrogenase
MNASSLKEQFGDRLKENEPLAKHVNFRIGGPARWYIEAKTSDEIGTIVRAARTSGLKFAVLGGGSNTLPSDQGFDGLVIQAANRNWSVNGEVAAAEAGVLSSFLARKTAEAGLTGFEWAATLPGTIGGAVRGNAGCFGGEMSDVIESVEALDLNDPAAATRIFTDEECLFGYRDSIFKRGDFIVLAAVLKLTKAPVAFCLDRLEKVLEKRKAEQPTGQSSAGCMFKNFEYQDDEAVAKLKSRLNVPPEFLSRKRIPAGWLIERADLKGKKIGDAQVSDKHGNFLVNSGSATASEVIQLISLVKMKIRDEYGIQLEEEVQLLGF